MFCENESPQLLRKRVFLHRWTLLSICLLFTFVQRANTQNIENSYTINTGKADIIVCTNYKDWSWVTPKDCGFWRPSKEEVLKGEAAIARYLMSCDSENMVKIAKKLSDYHRQCIGIVVNRQRRIFYSFICNGYKEGRTEKPFVVKDGGDCFFDIEYDLRSDKCDSLRLHGEA